ncbi:unnamed protein product [Cyclocybe aegerita]|uniref:F-box domain-containing protein n=1 Tax=Cyclocybe aegerita TaxID=1973307 RepID=A0A8S0VYG6_CYCAE|nr:unnamed protein product [Cyclocybe aegerita]
MSANDRDTTVTELLAAVQLKLESEDQQGIRYGPGNRDDVRAEILQQIQTGKQIMSRLWTRYNAAQPISQLPVETLLHIFSLTQPYDHDIFPPLTESELKGMNAWIAVAQVCHHWRTIALGDRRLWSNIVLGPTIMSTGDPDLALGALVERMGPHVPFHLHLALQAHARSIHPRGKGHVYSSITHPQVLLRFLGANSACVRSLHVSGAAYMGSNALWKVLDQALPALESLHLSLAHEDSLQHFSQAHTGGPSATRPLPRILQGAPSNTLKKLSLQQITHWPENKGTFAGLTHLALMDQYPRERLHFVDFLHLLQRLPLLEVLGLFFAGPQRYDGNSDDNEQRRPKTSLARLRKLEFEWTDGQDSPCQLLEHMDLNNKPSLEIVLSSKSLYGGDRSRGVTQRTLPPPELLQTVTCLLIQNDGTKEFLKLTTSTLPNAPKKGVLEINTSMGRDTVLSSMAKNLPNVHDVRVYIPTPSRRSASSLFDLPSSRSSWSPAKSQDQHTLVDTLDLFPKLTHVRLEYAFDYSALVSLLALPVYEDHIQAGSTGRSRHVHFQDGAVTISSSSNTMINISSTVSTNSMMQVHFNSGPGGTNTMYSITGGGVVRSRSSRDGLPSRSARGGPMQEQENSSGRLPWPNLKVLTVHELPTLKQHRKDSVTQHAVRIVSSLYDSSRKGTVSGCETGDLEEYAISRDSITAQSDSRPVGASGRENGNRNGSDRPSAKRAQEGGMYVLVIVPRKPDGSLRVNMKPLGRVLPKVDGEGRQEWF